MYHRSWTGGGHKIVERDWWEMGSVEGGWLEGSRLVGGIGRMNLDHGFRGHRWLDQGRRSVMLRCWSTKRRW